jgi:hypothetical protein
MVDDAAGQHRTDPRKLLQLLCVCPIQVHTGVGGAPGTAAVGLWPGGWDLDLLAVTDVCGQIDPTQVGNRECPAGGAATASATRALGTS